MTAVPTEEVAVAPEVAVEQTRAVALTGFAEVLTSVVSAVQQSGDALVNTSPALYWQVHEQWPDPELLPWNYALFTDIFLAPLAPLVIGPVNDAIAEAVAEALPGQADVILRIPDLVEYAVVRAVGPVLSAIGAAGAAHEQIYYSTTTWEIAPFIEAVLAAPGHVVDGFLNGGYGDLRPLLTGEVGGDPIPAPGLLTPWGADPVQRYADDNAALVGTGAAADNGQAEATAAAEPTGTGPQTRVASVEQSRQSEMSLSGNEIRPRMATASSDDRANGVTTAEPTKSPTPLPTSRPSAADDGPNARIRGGVERGEAERGAAEGDAAPTRRGYGAPAGEGSTSKPSSMSAASR
ncbi:hypothetical protein ACN27E_10100 [Mycobacterium sp. WMMD1722]|uniref:hypothetical protein n=1 Tax=Mycobacterium sp. WMMD1722 TaxID=3404117 RepID=UPI003BF4ACED